MEIVTFLCASGVEICAMGVNKACTNTCRQDCFTFLRSRVPGPFPAFSTERKRLPGKHVCVFEETGECAFKELCMLNRPR